MISQLSAMLQMQDAMNTRVNAAWREQHYPWYRAIWTESAELMEHYGWKWWKKQVPDIDQVKLELVDIWHFGLSIRLQSGRDAAVIAEEVAKDLSIPGEGGDFRAVLERFTLHTLQHQSFDVPLFAQMMAAVAMDFEELFVRYMGKNVLNFFRQDHGYQEGTYRKNWAGKEDNEHLAEIVANLDAASHSFKDDIYQSLKRRYQESVASP